MREAVHELDLPEHVGSVTGQDVHLQSHDLTRHAMLHLREEQEKGAEKKVRNPKANATIATKIRGFFFFFLNT